MEQARVLIAIVLSFAVFFLWNFFFVEEPPPKDPATEPTIQEPKEETAEPIVKPEPEIKPLESKVLTQPVVPMVSSGAVPRVLQVESPLYSIAINERGAVFQSYVLKKFREELAVEAPYKELVDAAASQDMLRLSWLGNSIPELDQAVFAAIETADKLEVLGGEKQLTFQWVSESGVQVQKRYIFQPDSYLIEMVVDIYNGSSQPLIDKLVLGMKDDSSSEKAGYSFSGPSAMIDNKLEQVKTKKIKDQSEYQGNIKWLAIVDRYFMKGIMPKETTQGVMKLSLSDNGVLGCRFIGPERSIQPGNQAKYEYEIFFGPKSMAVLKEAGHDLNRALDFGMFDFIAKPLLWFMNFIYGLIPNYGIAIIVMTILVKVVLWPLGSKSYKSMNEMKRLQPLMAEIREKYKHDKKQMNQEIMSLYRTYKINPMGGCLPMVLQIPVFFALYRMLYQAIELRHAPFFLWINDLSAPDRLFNFGFTIPFMQPPYGIPVLTVIMGATMLLQQKMSPPPGDPTQAKMMMLMPIVFTVIFINFSSGLVLYWLINNILSIGQQFYIQKKYA